MPKRSCEVFLSSCLAAPASASLTTTDQCYLHTVHRGSCLTSSISLSITTVSLSSYLSCTTLTYVSATLTSSRSTIVTVKLLLCTPPASPSNVTSQHEATPLLANSRLSSTAFSHIFIARLINFITLIHMFDLTNISHRMPGAWKQRGEYTGDCLSSVNSLMFPTLSRLLSFFNEFWNKVHFCTIMKLSINARTFFD